MGPKVKAAKPAKKPAEAKPKAGKATRPKAKTKPTAVAPAGDEWTQEKIHEAMERAGLTGRALAERLKSKNGTPPQGVQVNRWGRGAERVPAHYWSQLDRIFGGGK
jgi:ribosome-binding protein aMBF1 (putative translation factor)